MKKWRRFAIFPIAIALMIFFGFVDLSDKWLVVWIGIAGYVLVGWKEPAGQNILPLAVVALLFGFVFWLVPESSEVHGSGRRVVSFWQWLCGGFGFSIAACLHSIFGRLSRIKPSNLHR